MEPLLLGVREAARALAIGQQTLLRLARAGDVPCVRIGRSVRFRPSDLRTWIDARVATESACA
jgi:excisionase family DNA binding protein